MSYCDHSDVELRSECQPLRKLRLVLEDQCGGLPDSLALKTSREFVIYS